ncbi:unnamed protein product [Bursaphelenchus okinawaensis]|uniref:Reverse transcriptase domain-containing protein n=1 Tax=Bursaphelenchus okinawaensis TaxID=465554 RepID=A0A811L8W3_9BILA|nr:unnamed protein product [Bursaphelenchus okinawaensis]CAG9118236.1 unnamed protein product [Bursaphelenchus okinawaensis]
MLDVKLLDEKMASSSLVLIMKKGDVMDINNYRPISMATTMYKILSRIGEQEFSECLKIGLVINKQKTMWMGEVDGALYVNGEAIQKTSWYKYLGQHFEMPRRTDIEVQKRIQAAWAAFRAEYDLLTSRRTELGTEAGGQMEARTVSKKNGASDVGTDTTGFEVRSRQIRARTKLKDVVEVAITIKWKMAAKIPRAGNERLDWKVLIWIPEGKRRVGRPRMRWEDEFVELCVRDWLNRCRHGIGWNTALVTSIGNWREQYLGDRDGDMI